MKQSTIAKLLAIALFLTILFSAVWVTLGFINYYKYRSTNVPVTTAYKIQSALTIYANVNFFILLLCIVEMVHLSNLASKAATALILLILILIAALVGLVLVFLTEFGEVLVSILSTPTAATYNYNAEQLFGTSIYALLALTAFNIILGIVVMVLAFGGVKEPGKKKSASLSLSSEEEASVQSVQNISVLSSTLPQQVQLQAPSSQFSGVASPPSAPAVQNIRYAGTATNLVNPLYGAPASNNPAALNAVRYPSAYVGKTFGRYTT